MISLLLASFIATSIPLPPPNIVFILVDDMGWKDVGFMGGDVYDTPNIDSIAEAGVVFTNAYACAPNCAPSRACLMSGLYAPRHGVYTVGTSARGKPVNRRLIPIENNRTLEEEFVTIAEALGAAGWRTATIGKWHLGDDPTTQGFDVNAAGYRAGHPPGGYFSPYNNPKLTDGPDGEYLTERMTDEAIAFIGEEAPTPFFLYLPYYSVHTPIQAPEESIARYRALPRESRPKNPKYAGMIATLDSCIGRLLRHLDEHDLAERTIVIFTSDNGGLGSVTSMAPLRGSKGMLYEGGIRVPLAMRWPRKIEGGRTVDTPVIAVDYFPTLLEWTGVRPPDLALDGTSIAPLASGASMERGPIYWHFPCYLEASRRNANPWRTTPAGAIRDGDWKLIEFFETGAVELYNLRDDIGETTNLADDHPDRAAALLESLRAWRTATEAPVPSELNPQFVDPAETPATPTGDGETAGDAGG